MKFPPVRGRITFEGFASTKFWIRVFGLEGHVALAQSKINERPERRMAAVPIISEYEVDPGRLTFYYAIQLQVDALGVQDGIGLVLFADKENAEKAISARDNLATQILELIAERRFAEEPETFIVERGKET